MMWDTSAYQLRPSTENSLSEHSNNIYNVNTGGFLRLLESINSGEEPNMVGEHKEAPYTEIGHLITDSMEILQNKFTTGSGERYITTKGLNDEGQGHYFSEWSSEGQQFLQNEMQQHWQQETISPIITDTAQFFTNGDSPITDATGFTDIKDFDVQMWPCIYTNDAIMPINNLDLVNFISDYVDLENLDSTNEGYSDTWEPTPIFRASDFDEVGFENQEAKEQTTNQMDHKAQNVSIENYQYQNDPVDIRMTPCIVTSSFVAPLSPEDILELVGTQIENVPTSDQNHEEETNNSFQLPNATISRYKAIYESSEQLNSLSSTSFSRFKGKPDFSSSQSTQCSSVPRILTPDRLRMQEALHSPSSTSNEDTHTECGQDPLLTNVHGAFDSPFAQSDRPSSRASSDSSQFLQLPTTSRTAAQCKLRLDGPSHNLIPKTIVDNSQRRRCATPVPWLTVEENENLRKSKIINEWSTTLVPWITNVQNYWEERDGFRQPESVSEYHGRFHLKKHQRSPEKSTESFVSIADEFKNRCEYHEPLYVSERSASSDNEPFHMSEISLSSDNEPFHVSERSLSSDNEPFHVSERSGSADSYSSEYQLYKRPTVESEVSDLELSALYESASQKQYTELTNVARSGVSSGITRDIETTNFPEFQYHQVNVVSSSMELFHGCPVSRNYMVAVDQMSPTAWSDGMEEADTGEQAEHEFVSDAEPQSSFSLENSKSNYSLVNSQSSYALDSKSCGSFSSEISSAETHIPSLNISEDGDGQLDLPGQSPINIYSDHVGRPTPLSGLAPIHIFIGQIALIQARPFTNSAGQNSKLDPVVNSKDYFDTSRCYYSYGDERTKMIPIVPQSVRADNRSLHNVPSSSERRNKRLSKNKTNEVYPGSAKLLHICNKLKVNKRT